MQEISHILVPTNLAEAMRAVYGHTAGLAAAYGARVTLLHVDEVAGWAYRDHRAFERYHQMAQSLRQKHANEARTVFAARSVKMKFRVIEGERKRTILDFVRQREVDLAVMGVKGDPEARLGATTQRILRVGGVPVLVVRRDATRREQVRRVMACADLSPLSRAALTATATMAVRLGAKSLMLAHVVELPRASAPALVPALEAARVAALDDVREQLEELGATLGGGVAIEALALSGDSASRELARAASEHRADLVTLASTGKGAFQRLLLGSTAQALARRSSIPVMVMPRAYLDRKQGG